MMMILKNLLSFRNLLWLGIGVSCLVHYPVYAAETVQIDTEKGDAPTETDSKESIEAKPLEKISPFAQALAGAYTTNSELKARVRQSLAQHETVPQARAGFLPNINLQSTAGKQRTVTQRTTAERSLLSRRFNQTPATAGVEVTQSLYSGGGTIAAMDRAEHGVTADHYGFLDREQRTLLDAVTAYMDVIFRRAAIDFNEANVKSLSEQLEAVRAALEVGERTLTDVAQIESRLARGKADLADAQRDLATANATYIKVIGSAPGLIEEPKLLTNLPQSKDELITIAQDSDPRVLSAAYSEKAAKRQIDERSAGLLPRVDLTGNANRNLQTGTPDTHFNSASATLKLTVPVIQQGTVWSQSRQAVQEAAQARHNLDQRRKEAREDAIKAWETWVAALQRIEHFKAQVKFAALSRDGAILEAEVGERSYLDVLDAQTELLQAQLGLVQARRDEIVAEYAVLQSMGKLTAKYLQLPVEHYKIDAHYERVRKKVFGWGKNPKYPTPVKARNS